MEVRMEMSGGPVRGSGVALFLEEHLHRTANEVAACAAAMHIARPGASGTARRLLDDAIERIEGFGETSRLIAGAAAGPADAGLLLSRMCGSMLKGRPAGVSLSLDVESVVAPGATCHTLLLVAYELVTNAFKHALHKGGKLGVRLVALGDELLLTVSDDAGAPVIDVPARGGGGLGGGIVRDLLDTVGGSIDRAVARGGTGTTVRVMIPVDGGRATGRMIDV